MKAMYKEYMNRENEASDYFTKLKLESRKIKKTVTELAEKRMYIPTYLMYPIQRLPRYLLLLESLTKNTPSTMEEYTELIKVKDKANEILDWLNSEMSVYQNNANLRKWESVFELEQNNHRTFIDEFHQIMIKEEKKVHICSVVIFSDYVGIFKTKKNKRKIKHCFALDVLTVFDIDKEKNGYLIKFVEKNVAFDQFVSSASENEIKRMNQKMKESANEAKRRKFKKKSSGPIVTEDLNKNQAM